MNCLNLNNFKWKGKGKNESLIYNGDNIFSIDPNFFRKTEVDRLKCDVKETYIKLKWKPKIYNRKLIQKLINDEIALYKFNRGN